MPYFVKVPRELEEKFSRHLKKIGENGQYAFFQGVDVAIIPLEVSWPEAFKLVREVKVEGGFKRLPKTVIVDGVEEPASEPTLIICPKRGRILTVRLSDEEYELLREDARSVGRSVSGWARELVMSLVYEYLAREKFKAALREIEEVCKGCIYWRRTYCNNPDVPREYKDAIYRTGEKKNCEYKVTTSE